MDTYAYQNSIWPVREWTTVQLVTVGIWPARCSPINDRTVLEPNRVGGVLLTIIPQTPWLLEVLGLFRSCGWQRSASRTAVPPLQLTDCCRDNAGCFAITWSTIRQVARTPLPSQPANDMDTLKLPSPSKTSLHT